MAQFIQSIKQWIATLEQSVPGWEYLLQVALVVTVIAIWFFVSWRRHRRGERRAFRSTFFVASLATWNKLLSWLGLDGLFDQLDGETPGPRRSLRIRQLTQKSLEQLSRDLRRDARSQGRLVLRAVDKALDHAAEATLSVDSIASLYSDTERLTECYVQAVEQRIDDKAAFARIKPVLERVYPTALDTPGFFALIQPELERLQSEKIHSASAGLRLNSRLHHQHLDEQTTDIATLFFSFQLDHFTGRDELVERVIHTFLDFPGTSQTEDAHEWFRWALLYGEAGSGKAALRWNCSTKPKPIVKPGACRSHVNIGAFSNGTATMCRSPCLRKKYGTGPSMNPRLSLSTMRVHCGIYDNPFVN